MSGHKNTEIEHDDEMIEVPIVPEPLSAVSSSVLDITRKSWYLRVESPMHYLFEHKMFPHFTCSVTIVGRGDNKFVSFDMRSFSGTVNEKLNGGYVLRDANELLDFISTLY